MRSRLAQRHIFHTLVSGDSTLSAYNVTSKERLRDKWKQEGATRQPRYSTQTHLPHSRTDVLLSSFSYTLLPTVSAFYL